MSSGQGLARPNITATWGPNISPLRHLRPRLHVRPQLLELSCRPTHTHTDRQTDSKDLDPIVVGIMKLQGTAFKKCHSVAEKKLYRELNGKTRYGQNI